MGAMQSCEVGSELECAEPRSSQSCSTGILAGFQKAVQLTPAFPEEQVVDKFKAHMSHTGDIFSSVT